MRQIRVTCSCGGKIHAEAHYQRDKVGLAHGRSQGGIPQEHNTAHFMLRTLKCEVTAHFRGVGDLQTDALGHTYGFMIAVVVPWLDRRGLDPSWHYSR